MMKKHTKPAVIVKSSKHYTFSRELIFEQHGQTHTACL